MRKEVVFNGWVWNLLLQDGQVVFYTVKVENGQESL